MTEEFLFYVWEFSLFDFSNLTTKNGEPIKIVFPGTLNTISGPDFQNAKIQIGDTLWAGNVEIHTYASHWEKHKHQKDKAYENVILHVVYFNDKSISNDIPVLELNGKIHGKYQRNYKQLMQSKSAIPCAAHISSVSKINLVSWQERLVVNRMERKVNGIASLLVKNKGDWAETFYQFMARGFAMKHNALPMEWLARSVPLNILSKHKNSLVQIEALLLGQAGFLNESGLDTSKIGIKQLQDEYVFLKSKYKLEPLDVSVFKTGGVRPPNQPTIRIAQLAKLIYQSKNLFRIFMETEQITDFKNVMEIQLREFWTDRYHLKETSKKRIKKLGDSTIHSIVINIISPFLFLYGKHNQEFHYQERAFDLLRSVPKESNAIVKSWKLIGIEASSAYETQSLIELKNEYCKKKKCLSCAIGHQLLKHE